MCKELEEELKTAKAPALALVQHLERMKASMCVVPVVIPQPDGKVGHWKVTVEFEYTD